MNKVNWKLLVCDEYLTEEPNTSDGKWDWQVEEILVQGGRIEIEDVSDINNVKSKIMNKVQFTPMENAQWKHKEDGSYTIIGESDDYENPWEYMELRFSLV